MDKSSKFFMVIPLILLFFGCSSGKKYNNIVDDSQCFQPLQSSDKACYERKFLATIIEEKLIGPAGNIINQKQCQVREGSNLTHIVSLNFFDNKLGPRVIGRIDSNNQRQIIFGKKSFETIQLECKGEWKEITKKTVTAGAQVGIIPWGGQLTKFIGDKKCKEIRRRYKSYSSTWKKKRLNTYKNITRYCGNLRSDIKKAFPNSYFR